MSDFKIVKLLDAISISLTGPSFTGAYNGATTYQIGQSVSYNGSSYVALAVTLGNLPTDTSFWQLIASKGDTGSPGPSDHLLLTNIGTNTHAQIDTHIADTSNPHAVTKSQVGLGNADNTSDINKPISTATQTALDIHSNSVKFSVGIGRLYTTIQSALNAIGAATNVTEFKTHYYVTVAGGIYDESLTIPRGRSITLIAEGQVILGDGAGANWASTTPRSITTDFRDVDAFGSDIKPALNIISITQVDPTSTFLAEAGCFRISGNLNIAGGGGAIASTVNLISVKIDGLLNASSSGLVNLLMLKTYIVGTITGASTILQRIIDCQFDSLISVDGYNSFTNCEIKAGMTVVTNFNTLPPSGIFHSTLFGTFTGPASSIKLDLSSDYFFRTNSAVLGGAATKVLLSPVASASVAGVLSSADWNTFSDHISNAIDAHDASAISNIPSGNLSSTDVQSALDELQTDINSRSLDSLVVHLAGTETITGAKTFYDEIIIAANDFASNPIYSYNVDPVGNTALIVANDTFKSLALGIFGGTALPYGAITSNHTYIYSGGESLTLMSETTGSKIKFATSGTAEQMRLSENGNLLINTTTDNATDKLQVNGSMTVSNNRIKDVSTPTSNTDAANKLFVEDTSLLYSLIFG